MSTFRRSAPGQTSGFVYHRRSAVDVEKRAKQTGGSFESYIREDIPVYKVKEGTNILRILPPPSRDYDHYGIDIFTHYGIGVEKNTYLCPNKMLDKPCPVCEEHSSVLSTFGGRQLTDQDKDNLRPFNAGKRVLTYVIDRNEEDKGPQAWPGPWTLDRDINNLRQDKFTGEILWIDDPEVGFDVAFTRQGTGLSTKYVGVDIAKRESALHRDANKATAWLKFVTNNGLRDILIYREYDRIHKALHQTTGGVGDSGSGAQGSGPQGDDDGLPTDAEIERMDPEELDAIAAELDIDVDGVEDNELTNFLMAEVSELRETEPQTAMEKARALSARNNRGGPSKDLDDDIPF